MATVGVMGGCGIGKNAQIHRVKAADSINKMGKNMLGAIGRARERGEEVDDTEEQRAWRFKKGKIDPKTWEDWRRKYNESGARAVCHIDGQPLNGLGGTTDHCAAL